MPHAILVIADDLTGALEAGAQFAARGFVSSVSTAIPAAHDVPVAVIDTETRHLAPSEAYAVVYRAAVRLRPSAPWLIYKKTDSTLRGNIAAEFRALLDSFPERPLIYAPAYPAMGRTLRDGRLYVRGVPAHLTEFAADPLNPVRDSDVRALLEGIPIIVRDAESDVDVLAAARSILASDVPVLAAGPAALAGALADCIRMPRGSGRPSPRLSRCLIVNGSLHPASIAQIEFARKQGCFVDGWQLFEETVDGTGVERALRTGECVRRRLESSPVHAIVVFGGDTAFGIHRALGALRFDSYREVVPGVPLSRSGELFWITKAGGFGDPAILCEIQRRLR